MEIDSTFPTKLDTVSDAPEPLRSALVNGLPSGETVRLLVHAPAFPAGDKISPATVLAVTNNGWLVASESEDGDATVARSDFGDTLFLKLTSILLLGQLRISFAAAGASHSVTINFETVGDELYREAIDLLLAGVDPALATVAEKAGNEASIFEGWPIKFRSEAQRYWARGQRLLAAAQWPAMIGESRQELAPAGALLITERELVLISEEKRSSGDPTLEVSPAEESKGISIEQAALPTLQPPMEETSDEATSESLLVPGDVDEFGDIITFVPRVRLADFQVSRRERFDVLALQVQAAHGGEKLEIIFPSDDEKDVSKAMEQVLLSRSTARQTIGEKLV